VCSSAPFHSHTTTGVAVNVGSATSSSETAVQSFRFSLKKSYFTVSRVTFTVLLKLFSEIRVNARNKLILPTSEHSKIPHSVLVICYENFWCVNFPTFAGVCPLFNIIIILSCSTPHPSPPQPPMSTPTLPPFSAAISNIHYVETFQISFLNISVCQWTDSWNEVLYFISAGSIMFTSLKKLCVKTFCSTQSDDNYVIRLRLQNKTGTKDLSTICILFKAHPFYIDTASGTIQQRLEGPLHVFLWYGPKTRRHSCLDVLNIFKQAPFQWQLQFGEQKIITGG